MEIDQKAILKSNVEIDIFSTNEKVWSLLSGINLWKKWQPDVSESFVEGNLAAGVKFNWRAKGLHIRSELQLVEPFTKIGWTGKSLGMNAVHIWTIEPKDNFTHVTTEESLSGWFPRLLKLLDPNFLNKSLSSSLKNLKQVAERN